MTRAMTKLLSVRVAAVTEDSESLTGSSGGTCILDISQGLLGTVTEQLESARKAELQSKQNYDMKKQSLEDEIKYANGDLAETKKPEEQTPRPRQQQIENLR